MTNQTLKAERDHLAGLLEAMQRCVYFLDGSRNKLAWPLTSSLLAAEHKNVTLFESLASVNERFSKLQDTLGAAMRHAALLAGETAETFLQALTFFEKVGVLGSVTDWQLCRATRNVAAHDYETDYAAIAEHFNALNELIPVLYADSARFLVYCRSSFDIVPLSTNFSAEFAAITAATTA